MSFHALSCSPEGDDVLVIDGLTLTSTKHDWKQNFDHVLVAAHYVFKEVLPRTGVDGSPFRSLDSATIHVVVALDAFGVIHALDPLGGDVLFSLPALGKPRASAASLTELAIALEDRLVVWNSGTKTETASSFAALAYGESGLVTSERALSVAQIAKDRLVVGTPEGVFEDDRRLVDGAAIRMRADAEEHLVVVQRSDTMLAVYDAVGWKPLHKIHYAECTITGFELIAGRVLVVALDGGRTNRIDLRSGAVTKTGVGLWKVEVEDAAAKPVTSHVTGRIGHRRGVVAIIPVASAAALCLWTYLERPPAHPPPSHFQALPVASAATPAKSGTACNGACEADRLDALVAACATADPKTGCEEKAKGARDAFGIRQCAVAHMELSLLSAYFFARPESPASLVEALKAADEGLGACVIGPLASYNLLGLRDGGEPPLAFAAPDQNERPIGLDVDKSGGVYVLTVAKEPQRCVLYRRVPNVDASWKAILTASGCSDARFAARTEGEVYFASGDEAVKRWDGTHWNEAPGNVDVLIPPKPPPSADLLTKGRVVVQRKDNDVFVGGDHGLFHFDGSTWSTVLRDPVDFLAGNDRAVWVMTRAN